MKKKNSGNIYMATNISDEKTIKLAQEKTEGRAKGIDKTFKHMMIDFNIIPYVVAFAIAMSFSNMMMNMSSSLLEVTGIKKHGLMLSSVLSFILTLVSSYVLGYLIFYKVIYTEDVAQENIVKKVINKEKEKEVEKKIKRDEDTKRDVKKAGDLKIEGFCFDGGFGSGY